MDVLEELALPPERLPDMPGKVRGIVGNQIIQFQVALEENSSVSGS